MDFDHKRGKWVVPKPEPPRPGPVRHYELRWGNGELCRIVSERAVAEAAVADVQKKCGHRLEIKEVR